MKSIRVKRNCCGSISSNQKSSTGKLQPMSNLLVTNPSETITVSIASQCVDMLFQKYLRDKEVEVQKVDLLAIDRKKNTDSDDDDDGVAADIVVDVTVGQVVYAAFKLHCSSCALPLNICKFPGCSLIRGRCRAIVNTEEYTIGSGLHPIEREIRNVLFSGDKMIFDYFPMASFNLDYSAVEEIALEAEEDRVAQQIQISDQSATFKWQEISAEGEESHNLDL